MSLASQVTLAVQAIGTRIKAVETTLAGKQPIDADLTSIAALASAAGKSLRATAAQTWALFDVTDFATTFLDDGNATSVRATLGVPSVAEAQSYGVQTGVMATANVTATTTVPATATSPNTVGYITGLTVTITGEGRPVRLVVHIGSVKRLTATVTSCWAYLNQNDAQISASPVKNLNTTDPGSPCDFSHTTGVLTSGVSYRFNVGLYVSGLNGTLTANAVASLPMQLTAIRG